MHSLAPPSLVHKTAPRTHTRHPIPRWEGDAGADFKLYGFSHKLPLLAAFVFRSLARLRVDPERFPRVKEALLRSVRAAAARGTAARPLHVMAQWLTPSSCAACPAPLLHVWLPRTMAPSRNRTAPPFPQYRNVNMSPSRHATYQRLLALKPCFWHADRVAAELAGVEAREVQVFLPALLQGLHVEALLHGNIAAGEAADLARRLHAELGGAAVPADARPPQRCVQLPQGCSLLHRRALLAAPHAAALRRCRASLRWALACAAPH
jgi:hypothetical protein